MGDTPKNEWAVPMFTPEGKPQRCSWGRDGMVMCASDGEWVEWEHYAELEQAVKDRDEWIDELHACLFQPGPVGLHTLLLVAQGIARAAVDARQGAQDGQPTI